MLRTVKVKFDGEDGEDAIELSLNINLAGVGIGGDLWPAANLFSNLMASRQFRPFFKTLLEDKSILELGAGVGLCGILADRLFNPQRVVLSDQLSHMELLAGNVALNGCSKRVEARELDWTAASTAFQTVDTTSRESLASYPTCFDVILAMECVYKETLYEALLDIIVHCSSRHTVTFLGLTRQFTKPRFFSLCAERHLLYTLVPHEALPPGCGDATGGRDCGLLVLRKA